MAGDIFSPVTPDTARLNTIGAPAARPPAPGFLETIGLSFREAGTAPDWGLNQSKWESEAEAEIEKALTARGWKKPPLPPEAYAEPSLMQIYRDRARDAMLAEAARVRAADPAFLPDFAAATDRRSFQALVHRRRADEAARLGVELQDAGTVPWLIGSLGHGLTDPTSYIPVGGVATGTIARQIIGTAGREAAANVGVAVLTEPLVRMDADALGIERTLGDTALDIGIQGLTGAVVGGSFKAGELGATRLIEGSPATQEGRAALAEAEAIDPSAPPGEAFRLLSPNHGFDPAAAARAGTEPTRRMVADFEARVPPDRQTPDERAAVAVLTRDAEIREASPFEASAAGDDAAFGQLGKALDALATGPRPVAVIVPEPRRARGTGGRAQFMARVRGAESGGNDAARNPRSSAGGRYQFTNDTWARYHRRVYGGDGLTDKFDPAKQERLMAELTADNQRALAGANVPLTAGNYYLAHFAGAGGAVAIHRAAPGASVGSVLGAHVVRANPFLDKMTARELIAWAERTMGGAGDADTPTPMLAGEAAPIVERPDLIDAIAGDDPVRRALAEAADIEGQPLVDLPAFEEAPVLRRELFASDDEWLDAQARLDEQARQPLFDNRAAVEEAMARRDAAPAAASEARPKSLLEFIAERGGIEDVGGDLDAMGAADWHRQGPFRRQLLRQRSPEAEPGMAQSPKHGPDALFAAAIDADYFPHLAGRRGDFLDADGADALPDMAEFLEAIDEELRGRPSYPGGQVIGRARDADEGLAEAIDEEAAAAGVRLDADTAEHVLAAVDRGLTVPEAIEEALQASWRDVDGFDGPEDAAWREQVDSLEHDLRMLAEADPDLMFDPGDGESGATSLAEMLRGIDEEEAEAKALLECLAPIKGVAA